MTLAELEVTLMENDWPIDVLLDGPVFLELLAKVRVVLTGSDATGPYFTINGCRVRPKIINRPDVLDLSSGAPVQKRRLRGNETSTARE